MRKNKVLNTDDVLITLCASVTQVFAAAGNSQIAYSPMVQKIHKTCLRPDLGWFFWSGGDQLHGRSRDGNLPQIYDEYGNAGN